MDQAENLRNIIKSKNVVPINSRVITITSGKGGVGKSSISVNLAIQLQKAGKKVVIMDADFGLANVEVMLGIRPKYTLADLMYNGRTMKDIITMGPEGIGFISGGSGIQELSNLTKEQIIRLTRKLKELDGLVDVIIIDTGAGISESVLEFVMASSEVLLVVTPEPTSITDAYALLKTLNKCEQFHGNSSGIKIITNRVDNQSAGQELFHKLSIVVEKFLNIPLEYLGSIPQDTNVSKAVMQQKPFSLVYPNSPSSKAISVIANQLGDEVEIVDNKLSNGITGFFYRLIKTKYKN